MEAPAFHTSIFKSILILAIGMLFSCGNTREDIQKITFSESFPDERTRDAVIHYSDSAHVKVLLKAPLIDRYHGTNAYDEFPEGVDVTFFTDSNEVDSRITANYAKNLISEKIMEARNDVVVTNRDGDVLNTEHLVWDQATQRIYSDDFVKITTEEEIIYGDGLDANEDFTEYTIHHIKSILSVDVEQEPDPNAS